MFENYESLRSFIKRQYYENPAYAIGYFCNISDENRQLIITWWSWYYGHVNEFHDYSFWNGEKFTQTQRKTLGMAKKVCEDMSDMLVNEKFQVTMADEQSQEFIEKVLFKDNMHRSRFNELVEFYHATGTGATIPYVDSFGNININYLQGSNIIPIEVKNGKVISCAFASHQSKGDNATATLNVHLRIRPLPINATENIITFRRDKGITDDFDGYMIETVDVINEKGDDGVNRWVEKSKMDPVFVPSGDVPSFQLYHVAKANNYCVNNNGFGIALFANSIDQLQSCDLVYDSYVNEFQLGRKRIFVHDSLVNIEVQGEGDKKTMRNRFDTNEGIFQVIDATIESGEGQGTDFMIKEVNMELRIDEHEKGLSRMVNTLGFKCGFGPNYYKFEGGVLKTATEVISEKNPLYKFIKKSQTIVIEQTIALIRQILLLANMDDDKNFDVDQDITVEFDDSIFIDKETLKKSKLLELNSGIIDKVQYFMDVEGLTEEQAIDKVKRINARMMMLEPQDEMVVDDE